jgi:CDP-paratose 2-epimerase
MKILITGGAGFVGSQMAFRFKNENLSNKVVVFDNLRRRGSELNLPLFKKKGIEFTHGDIRNFSDLKSISHNFDLMIEASAEPSVHAGTDGDPSYLLQTNLVGTLNCLEYAREKCAKTIYLSTSRVYSIQSLSDIPLKESDSRFEIDTDKELLQGLTNKGISEKFDTNSYRSLYGASKLGSELVAQEYAETYGLDIIINRCGVIAGPGQWGKIDQGVFTLWVANHYFNKELFYTGFGGQGKQVRDLIHPEDLFSLLRRQLAIGKNQSGQVFNVGGGQKVSTSLKELTHICNKVTGNHIPINSKMQTANVDIPYYVSNHEKVSETFDWKPKRKIIDIVEDIYQWLKKDEKLVRHIFN